MAFENSLKTMKLEYFIEDPNLKSFRCAYGTSAGIDIFTKEEQIIPAKSFGIIKHNIRFLIPKGYYAQIFLRSSVGFKNLLVCHPGIIDAGYTGDWDFKMYNLGDTDFKIEKNKSYCQVLFRQCLDLEFKEVSEEKFFELGNLTERNQNGLGSSDLKSS